MIGDVSEVSEEEEQEMREQYESVKLKPSQKSRDSPSIHLPDGDDETLCDGIRGELRTKPFEVFPPGYFEVCRSCAAHWRKSNE